MKFLVFSQMKLGEFLLSPVHERVEMKTTIKNAIVPPKNLERSPSR